MRGASCGLGHSPGRTAPKGPPRAPRSPRSASLVAVMAEVNRWGLGFGGLGFRVQGLRCGPGLICRIIAKVTRKRDASGSAFRVHIRVPWTWALRSSLAGHHPGDLLLVGNFIAAKQEDVALGVQTCVFARLGLGSSHRVPSVLPRIRTSSSSPAGHLGVLRWQQSSPLSAVVLHLWTDP